MYRTFIGVLFPFNVNRLPIQTSALGSALEPNLSALWPRPYPRHPDLLNALCGANEDHPVSTYSVSVIMKINEKNVSMVLLY